MVRFVCLWAMIPWITLVVMADWGGTIRSPFFLKSFHLLDSLGGGDVPLGLHSTELVDSNPPPKNSIRKSTNSVLEQTEKVGSTTARGRTLPRNWGNWNVWVLVVGCCRFSSFFASFLMIIPRRTRWKTNSIFLAFSGFFFVFRFQYVGVGESMSGWMNSCEYFMVAASS